MQGIVFTIAPFGKPLYQAVQAIHARGPLQWMRDSTPRAFDTSTVFHHSTCQRNASFRIGCSSFSARPSHQRSETLTAITAFRPLCRRLTDDAEGQLGTITTQLLRSDDPYQYDTHQLNLVRSNTDTTAGIRTNPPHLSLPPAVDGNKPASYVNRDTRPPAARRRTQCTTPNLGRDALVAKSVHPALNDATRAAPPATPTTLQRLFRSPAEASHFMRDAPRTAPLSTC